MTTNNPNWPKFRWEWEQKYFGRYFRFALNGKKECSIWDYLTEMYRYKYIQTCVFGGLAILTTLILLASLYLQAPTALLYAVLFLAFNLGFFTGTCVFDTKKTRQQILAYWEHENKRKAEAQ